jgi:MYXO-CTERM domain-containing protein
LRVTLDHLIQDEACVSTVPPPFSADQEVCVALTAFDEAGHPSPPLSTCSIVASCGGFDPDTCGPTDECLPVAKGCGCSTTRGTATPFLLLLLAPLALRRRAGPKLR